MMKSAIKHHVSDSNNKQSALSELQKQKEKIMREMKEHEYRKNREKEQKRDRIPKPVPVIEKMQRERTPPPVVKKFPRIEQKSFQEAMREAELRTKQNSLNVLEKRKHSESVNISSLSIKKTANNQLSDKNPDVPIKKQRMNDYPTEKSKPMNLKPINSVKKPEPLNHSKSSSINRNNANQSSSNNKSNNFSQSQIRNSDKKISQGPSKSGILAQPNSGISSQNSSKPMKNGIVSQSSSRQTGHSSASSTKSGILARSNSRQSLPHSSTASVKNGIISQSSARTSNPASNHNGKPANTVKSNISNQNSSKNSSRVSTDSRNLNSQHSSSRIPADSHNQSRHSMKSIPNRNNNDTGKSGQRSYSPPKKPHNIPPSTGRGICAQNASQYQKSTSNYPPKSAYSNNPPARGIAAQNGSHSQNPRARGIGAQNGVYSHNPPARGIAAQNGARGIMAQSGSGRAPADFISGSEDEDEYDSDLGSFIDDTERDLTDQMKSEIYKSLNHDPTKYSKVSRYDDCKNMESRYNDICKEEMRSLRIGRAEDNQELAEEEKRLKRKGKLL